MPKRRCEKAGCRKLIDYSKRYCNEHNGSNDKYYNKYKRMSSNLTSNGKTEKEIANFYSSSTWRKVRKLVLIRDSYVCQICLRDGYVHGADMVHHKIELRAKNGWKHRLDMENLEAVNRSCHNQIKHDS
ncbi:hypothetical protein DOK78_002374 [Enterococcus sp. DIV2402]|uniref:Putative HNH nuclease YajD n=1 Tax=Candidatus Enterococcus lowellii TaxID=2230877 RepID=A0ABZ2STG0_9ENTE|nr:HNH endonuclease [Enterococcus sp. DIV2402]